MSKFVARPASTQTSTEARLARRRAPPAQRSVVLQTEIHGLRRHLGPVTLATDSNHRLSRTRSDRNPIGLAGFQDFIQQAVPSEHISEALVGAKLVGRYRSGAPLEGANNNVEDPALADATVLDKDRIN